MKIVHTESSCGWGGQEIRILSEVAGMLERGHEVQLLCPPEARIFTEAPRHGVPVTALPIGRKNLKGLLALRGWLAANPVDVINTHSSTDSWLAALAGAARRDPPAIVRTRHISAPVSRNVATRWLYRQAAQIVTTGESLRTHLIATLGVAAESVVSIPTGIDTERYQPPSAVARHAARAAAGVAAEVMLIGIVATLRSWKGHADLVEAFAHLPPSAMQLVIVGDGPQRERLTDQVAALGLAGRVHLVGNHSDVLPWLHAIDVFVLPSYANEGVPQALMQAMLAGLPCVTTDIGGIPEVALNEQTALVVKPRDIPALTGAIDRLAGDAALRQRLAAAARQHVAARFSRVAMLDRMETVFRAALLRR